MCYGFPTVTSFLPHCEARMSAALFKPHLVLAPTLFSLPENKAVNLCSEAEREGERSSKLKMWMRVRPPTEQVLFFFAGPHGCPWLCRTDRSSLVSSTRSARWCSSVSGGNRGALFTTLPCSSFQTRSLSRLTPAKAETTFLCTFRSSKNIQENRLEWQEYCLSENNLKLEQKLDQMFDKIKRWPAHPHHAAPNSMNVH